VTFPHNVFLTHAEDVFHTETTRAGSRSSFASRSGSAVRSRQRFERDELLFDFDFDLEALLFDFDLDVVPFDFEPDDFDFDLEPLLLDFEPDDFDLDVVPFDFELDDFDFDFDPLLFDFDPDDFDRDELPFDFELDDFDFDLDPLLFDFDALDFDFVPELFASPDCARCLLTVRAAISSARSSDRPASSSDSFTCSYWRSRFSLHAF
jgi:hypothetical protein